MRILIIWGMLIVATVVCSDCNDRSAAETRNVAIVTQNKSYENWDEMGLPIDDAKALTAIDNGIFLIGVKGFATIDPSNLNSRKIKINNVVSLLTKNGGLSFIKGDIDEVNERQHVKTEDILCSSESAVVVKGSL